MSAVLCCFHNKYFIPNKRNEKHSVEYINIPCDGVVSCRECLVMSSD